MIDEYLEELYDEGFDDDQVNIIKIYMACYALDAIHDSSVAEEALDICSENN